MATQDRRYCPDCEQYSLAERNGPNHILHGVLTVFTCAWGIVWAIIVLSDDSKFRCQNCGHPTTKRSPEDQANIEEKSASRVEGDWVDQLADKFDVDRDTVAKVIAAIIGVICVAGIFVTNFLESYYDI